MGVVVEARKDVREGALRGVVGREGRALREVGRWWGGAEVGVVDAMVLFLTIVEFFFQFDSSCFILRETRCLSTLTRQSGKSQLLSTPLRSAPLHPRPCCFRSASRDAAGAGSSSCIHINVTYSDGPPFGSIRMLFICSWHTLKIHFKCFRSHSIHRFGCRLLPLCRLHMTSFLSSPSFGTLCFAL